MGLLPNQLVNYARSVRAAQDRCGLSEGPCRSAHVHSSAAYGDVRRRSGCEPSARKWSRIAPCATSRGWPEDLDGKVCSPVMALCSRFPYPSKPPRRDRHGPPPTSCLACVRFLLVLVLVLLSGPLLVRIRFPLPVCGRDRGDGHPIQARGHLAHRFRIDARFRLHSPRDLVLLAVAREALGGLLLLGLQLLFPLAPAFREVLGVALVVLLGAHAYCGKEVLHALPGGSGHAHGSEVAVKLVEHEGHGPAEVADVGLLRV
mmetsp:Transcript_8254/g.28058  ORF Transcript_8254/g.28058 Transcript_8254/m.28058 type:complete len:260 (-) Transcript_8254:674-1453(-)